MTQIMKHFFTCFMVVVLLSTLSVDTEMLVVLKHCSNVFNKKYIDKLLTPRKPINRTTSRTSLDIYFKPGVVLNAPLYVHVETFKKFATQYKPHVIDYTAEVCQALAMKTHPMFIFFFHKTNVSESNYLNGCPMKVVLRFHQGSERTGTWRVEVTILHRGEKIFTLYSYYEVESKGLLEF